MEMQLILYESKYHYKMSQDLHTKASEMQIKGIDEKKAFKELP